MKDDPEQVYADIFHLPPHRSPKRCPMPMEERAAQFSSFDALAGHEQAINKQTEEHILHMENAEEWLREEEE